VRFILINGSSGFFSRSRELKTWDLLSPLLFVVVSEALCRMMDVTVDMELLLRISVGSRIMKSL
jgi:hypothetical protein